MNPKVAKIGLKALEKGAAIIVPGVVDVAVKGGNMALDAIQKEMEKMENAIDVTTIKKSKGSISLDDAKAHLTKMGLDVLEIVAKKHINHRNFSPFDVVDMHPKSNKVQPGTTITLYYVTQEVIEASQKLYDEKMLQKALTKEKQSEQVEALKEKASEVAKDTQQAVLKATDTAKKQIDKIQIKTPKIKKKKDTSYVPHIKD